MRGSSRAAAAAAQEAFDGVVSGAGDLAALGEQLFSVSALVDAHASLRRALADPSREASSKQLLAERLFGGKISPAATVLVSAVAGGRWSQEGDFSDTLESLAVQAFLTQAESQGRIDAVEDELFRFERIIASDTGLRDTLSSRNTDAEGKSGLVRRLLEGKAQPETIRLAEQAVTHPRGRRLDRVMETFLELASKRREELTALVTVADPLTEQQRARLRSALENIYGKSITLQTVLDKGVFGGIRVRIGDEVVDGTVLRRLDEARRHITGS